MMKSWSNPESETVTSYIGAVLNSGILLLTIQHWTTEEAAFPLFIFVIASVQVGVRRHHARTASAPRAGLAVPRASRPEVPRTHGRRVEAGCTLGW